MAKAGSSTRNATVLMIVTYAIGGVGLFLGFSTMSSNGSDLAVPALLAVGAVGILSFVRHALFPDADAERMGWSTERASHFFQVEVGLANLAWGLYAVLAFALDWGLVAQSAGFLIFGMYMAAVAIFEVLTSRGANRRPWSQVLPSAAFGLMLLAIGIYGMSAVN